MRYIELQELNRVISDTREPGERAEYSPVINALFPSQRFLIISSDPSSDTNKNRDLFEKHSSFEERVLALFFYGRDDTNQVEMIRADYTKYKRTFLENFYWTHFSKTYAAGSPGRFWADKFLLKEISLFEPEVIIIFGGIAAEFLMGKGSLRTRVNRRLDWNGITVLCTLHPSRDWNLRRRDEFDFYPTWELIRSACHFDRHDHTGFGSQ